MGRPRKQTVDYFPHFVTSSRTKDILQDKWGNDGYAVWFKLLELLGRSDGHYYDCTKTVDRDYLVSLMKVPEETVTEIINTLVEMEKLDRELWEERKIIWCQQFVDNLQDVYSKRTVSIPVKPFSEEFSGRKSPENGEKETEKEQEQLKPPEEKPKQRKKPGPKKKPEVEKKKYAEYVSMTEEEYGKLVEAHGEEKTKRMIEVLDNYKGSKGKTYKNDYRAILSWVVDRVNEEYSKRGGGSYGGYGTDRGYSQKQSADPGGFKPSGGFKGNG